MENLQKKGNIDGDRISHLPVELIERVMELLPVLDAAKTCVLSKKWRYVWANHPSLVLDVCFWYNMKYLRSPQKLDCANIVSSMLLHHIGPIHKFLLDVSLADVSSNVIDSWLFSVFRRNLKVLHLHLRNSDDVSNRYKVPFGVLLTSQLTDLSLSFCYIKEAVGFFTNIQKLDLENVELGSVTLTTPLLTSLFIKRCTCKSGFDVSAPKLASLTLCGNKSLNLKTFFTCTDIEYVKLESCGPYIEPIQADGKNLLKLLAFWPKVSRLALDRVDFKNLATGSLPGDNDDTLPLNLESLELWDVDWIRSSCHGFYTY